MELYFSSDIQKKQEKNLKIKKFQEYNYNNKQNCANTKIKFFNEEMEAVSELDFNDPNNQIKKNIIEIQKHRSGIMDGSNQFLQTYNERK